MVRINPLVVALLSFSVTSGAIDQQEKRRRLAREEASYGDTTREQILETRNRRKRQIKLLMIDAQKKLADHSSGEIFLTDEKKKELENSVDLYQRKIESLEVELEEWEIERLLVRETENAERRRERSRRSRNIQDEF